MFLAEVFKASQIKPELVEIKEPLNTSEACEKLAKGILKQIDQINVKSAVGKILEDRAPQ